MDGPDMTGDGPSTSAAVANAGGRPAGEAKGGEAVQPGNEAATLAAGLKKTLAGGGFGDDKGERI